jgi:FAD/FMN-containing dehydrogenase
MPGVATETINARSANAFRPPLCGRQYTAAITRALNNLITSMGGSISAEHGIGMDKLDELSHYRSQTELDIMRTIKRALDPQNIMNPGKVLRL